MQYQNSHNFLIKRKDNGSNKCVIAVEDMFETLKRIHLKMDQCDSMHVYRRSFTLLLNIQGVKNLMSSYFSNIPFTPNDTALGKLWLA